MEKDLEIAKSFFVLAQILGVVAGLFILGAGAFSVPATQIIDTQKTMFDLCKASTIDILDTNVSNYYNWTFSDCVSRINQPLTDYYSSTNSFSFFLVALGIILGLGSLLSWNIGKLKIEHPSSRHNLWLLTLLILTVIGILMARNITSIS